MKSRKWVAKYRDGCLSRDVGSKIPRDGREVREMGG